MSPGASSGKRFFLPNIRTLQRVHRKVNALPLFPHSRDEPAPAPSEHAVLDLRPR
jgi:hypothetical protein